MYEFKMFLKEEDITPRKILVELIRHRIVAEKYKSEVIKQVFKDYTIIIGGGVPFTGKTWLCDRLVAEGFKAAEMEPILFDLISFSDNKNHVRMDEDNKIIYVILNKQLESFMKTRRTKEE